MKPVYFDGALYVAMGMLTSMLATFSNDDNYKYFPIWLMVYGKAGCMWGLAGVTSLKMFRSTAYAKHQGMTHSGDTQVFTKQP